MIATFEQEALQHRAVRHPYLNDFLGKPSTDAFVRIQDFATQYGFYSAWFPRYLTAAISRLENPQHRNWLLENLAEESGQLHDEDLQQLASLGISSEWVQGIPHPILFRRFQKAIGVNLDAAPGIEVEIWRESFLQLIQHGSPAEAVGAIGLGTESIVKHLYRPIIQAIQKHTQLQLHDYVFFPLHTEVDDEHGKILLRIAEEMIQADPTHAYQLRKGMLKALQLRAAFWDGMMARHRIFEPSMQ